MCVSAIPTTSTPIPLRLPPPHFTVGYQPKRRSDNSQPHYRVVKYSTPVAMDEATGKETAHARVFCNAKGIDELDDFFTLYPRIDAWRAGSTFDVEILSGGDWKKIYNRPY